MDVFLGHLSINDRYQVTLKFKDSFSGLYGGLSIDKVSSHFYNY